MGSHEATRKTAHPLLNIPATILSSFQLRALFPGESHLWKTGQTPRCDPRGRPNHLCLWPHRHVCRTKVQPRPEGLSCASESSQAPAVLGPGQRARRVCGFCSPPSPSLNTFQLGRREAGAQRKSSSPGYRPSIIRQQLPVS